MPRKGLLAFLIMAGGAFCASPAFALLPAVMPVGGVQEPNDLFLPLNVTYDSAPGTSITFAGHTLTDLMWMPIDDGKQTQVSPPRGGSATSFFDVFAELTLDGHQYMGDGSVDVQITDPPSLPMNFDLEILSLEISGGTLPAGTEINLEPSPPSTGMETITPDPGGFRISSFFDIFTEISLDNGQQFTPASGALVSNGVPLPKSFWEGLALMALAGGWSWRKWRRAA